MKKFNCQPSGIVIMTFLLFLVSLSLSAQDDHHNFHKNHLALFNGVTSNLSHHTTSYSIGIDYEYRISQHIGTGILGEYIAAENGEYIGGLPLFIHLADHVKLSAVPLLINKKQTHEESHDHADANRETKFAFRLGVGYSFTMGKISVAPVLNFDMGNSLALIYGLSIGTGF